MFKNLQKFGAKLTVKAVEYAPQIMFGFGVIGFGATVVLAVKAAPKVKDILKKHSEDVEILHNDFESSDEYTEQEYTKDIRDVYRRTVVDVAKTTAPVILVGGVTLGLFGGSEYIVFKRLGRASAECLLLERSFKTYRDNVVAEEGVEKDRHYMFGTRTEKEKVETLDEEGAVEEKEVEREVGDPNSIFYVWSAETSGAYYGIELYDDRTLMNMERDVAKILDRNGFATDNDILGVLKMYSEIKKNGTYGMLYGVKATKDTGNEFKFDCHKIWVPDYTKGTGSVLKYQLRWDREKL